MMLRASLLVALLIGFASASAAENPDDVAFFEKKIRPLLVEKCQACHGAEKQKGNLRVDSKAALMEGGDRGPSLVPGKPDASFLMRVLAHDGEVKMPPKSKLPNTEIESIREWIQRGAVWPESKSTMVTSKATPNAITRDFTPEERTFWAFQPIRPQTVPSNPEATHPIDAFLAAKWKDNRLTPAAPADARTLIRRVTYSLTGLPPTPEDVDAFLRDSSPRAYEQLVDRLLASPAYGEKWGRRWLDVARYADSNGMDENLAYVNAWRYRDWVIRALNSDRPFSEFVRDQIAGDLVPGGTERERMERITATGFLVVGPKMLAEDDPVKMRMDIIDEQLDTIGQAFLGLTIGCARCHDHKFDPITMADYYGLAGMFHSTRTMVNYNVVATWNERPIGTPESIARLKEYTAKLDQLKAEQSQLERKRKSESNQKIAAERKRLKDYLQAASELNQRNSPLKLVESDPVRRPGTQVVQSENFSQGNVLKLTDGYGAGIGVIINAGPTPNFAEYSIDIATAGTYQLAVRYAALESRPLQILLNGQPIAKKACAQTTGSWNPDGQRWHAESTCQLSPGKATLRFERDGPIPHLDRFALIPLTADEIKDLPLNLEDFAKSRKVSPAILRQVAEYLRHRGGRIPEGNELEMLQSDSESPIRSSKDLDDESNFSQAIQSIKSKIADLEKNKPLVDQVMAVEDSLAADIRIHLRGNHLTLGAEAPRRLPRILAGDATLSLGTGRSGRLELANWMTHPDNPLTARVMVNRLWAGHFGQGLVRTPDNFGRLGERPTHPELLDWLAMEFIRANWSMKQMHRLIVTSNAFKLASGFNPADAENRFVSHYQRRRLDAEEIRDSMLAVSDLLDRTAGGTLLKANPRQYVTSTASGNDIAYTSNRRSVYLPVIRSAVYDVLQTLDFPDPSVPNGQRSATTIPTQALLMLNSSLADKTSEAFAKGLLDKPGTDAERIQLAYRKALGRTARESELVRVEKYLAQSVENADPALSADVKRLNAWRGFCRVLFASNEFVFVE